MSMMHGQTNIKLLFLFTSACSRTYYVSTMYIHIKFAGQQLKSFSLLPSLLLFTYNIP